VAGTAEALARALAMPAPERAARMNTLRLGVEGEDIGWWLRGQLEDLARIGGRRRATPLSPGRRPPAR
jgi:trehalose-6-phosphate synthase